MPPDILGLSSLTCQLDEEAPVEHPRPDKQSLCPEYLEEQSTSADLTAETGYCLLDKSAYTG